MTAKETPPIGRHSSRITACLANVLLAAATIVGAAPASAGPVTLIPGDLAVTYSVYPGLADPNTGSTGGYTTPNIVPTVTVLPINPNAPNAPPPTPVTAVADGTYPKVFNNASVDGNFGVTTPIYLGQITNAGKFVNTTDLTALTGITTSFSSKSELSLNLSTNGGALTFLGYNSPVGSLDRSNSNTPGHVDPTNTDIQTPTNRSVVQINADGSVQITNTNAYSGNNGRAAILAANVNGTGQNQYLLAGNAGNGGSPPPVDIVSNTGVQLITPGSSNPETTVVGKLQGNPGDANGFQYGFSVTQINPDTGKPYGPPTNLAKTTTIAAKRSLAIRSMSPKAVAGTESIPCIRSARREACRRPALPPRRKSTSSPAFRLSLRTARRSPRLFHSAFFRLGSGSPMRTRSMSAMKVTA